jgi:hypothetical protein
MFVAIRVLGDSAITQDPNESISIHMQTLTNARH